MDMGWLLLFTTLPPVAGLAIGFLAFLGNNVDTGQLRDQLWEHDSLQ